MNKRLTQAVFDLPECPEWSLMYKIIGTGYDTTNWKQSAINRDEK